VRDLILGVSMVRADGTPAKGGGQVVKNVAGFDVPRLLVGSLGTLGLLATVTFRVHPLPEASGTLLFPSLEPAQAWSLALAWREAQLEPGAAIAVASSSRLDLAVTFEGFAPGVASQSRKLLDVAARLGITGAPATGTEAAAHRARHDAVREGGSFRARIAVPPSRLSEVARTALPHVLGELSPCQAAWYPTLGLGFVSGEPSGSAALARGIEEARSALAAMGGTLVVSEAPHDVRAAVDVWGPPPPAFELMQNLKDRLDPDRRLNPGRFVGGL
jgi:glycolate oxidase FAD binding subunit